MLTVSAVFLLLVFSFSNMNAMSIGATMMRIIKVAKGMSLLVDLYKISLYLLFSML